MGPGMFDGVIETLIVIGVVIGLSMAAVGYLIGSCASGYEIRIEKKEVSTHD